MNSRFGLLLSAVLMALCCGTGESALAQRVRIPANNTSIRILKEVPLSTEIPGILVYVNPTEEGQFVRKGDIVIQLKDDVIRAQHAEALKKAESEVEIKFAHTALAKAQIDYEVQKEKNAKGPRGFAVFTESEMRQTELEVQKAQAQLEKSNEDKMVLQLAATTKETELGQYTVTAPEDGVVTLVHKWPGQAVRQGDSVLTVTDLTVLRAVLFVDYSYRDQILVGNQVEIRIGSTSRAPVSTAETSAVETERPRGASILDGAPGLRSPPVADPQRSRQEEPATPTFASAEPRSAEKFIGTITFISPKLSESGDLEVFVNVPNRQDNAGRYLLQQGVEAQAWILGN